MKKFLLLTAGVAIGALSAFALPEETDGVQILPDALTRKITHDGTQVGGDSEDGYAIYYNRISGEAYYYSGCSTGSGYVIADNGWMVGINEENSGQAAIMAKGESFTPDVFKAYPTGNIHSITPDASRICGVVGNPGTGPTYFPYVCDIDTDGNFGEIKILPYPEKDFFNENAQYTSAIWMSADGHTIAGQVKDARGFFIYLILWKEDSDGNWTFSYPSESLFNPEDLPIPEPIGELEDVFPEAEYPELENYMSPEIYERFMNDVTQWLADPDSEEESPYDRLDEYMTPANYVKYMNTLAQYELYTEAYNELFDDYLEKLYGIINSSVFFLQNSMALSTDGNMLVATSLQYEDTVSDQADLYIPYVFNLQTNEKFGIGLPKTSLLVDQIFDNGTVIANTINGIAPPYSFIYTTENGEFIPVADFMKVFNPLYGAWMEENLHGEIVVEEDELTGPVYTEITLTGITVFSDDFNVMAGGDYGSPMGYANILFSYILSGVAGNSGVGEIQAGNAAESILRVFNLQGVKIMETNSADALSNLPEGFYIVNGKKIAL